MRHAGNIKGKDHAHRFADYMLTQGVKTRIDEEGDSWAVWVFNEDKIELTKDELEWFVGNPEDPVYDAEIKANAIRREQEKLDKDAKKRIIRVRDQWGAPQRGMLTTGLIIVCVVIGIVTLFGKKKEPVVIALSINQYKPIDGGGSYSKADHLADVKSGQVWRLVTPMLIHFGPMHLVFNMMALYYFGNLIESRRDAYVLTVLILLIAIFSNSAQYQFSAGQSPVFGGMSGVVFGLFGFLWAKSLLDPTSGLILQPTTIFVMMFWFLLCITGAVGPIANWAHGAGLLFGGVLGIISTLSKEVPRT